jgi:hypothetical protein
LFEYVEPTQQQVTYRNNVIDWNSNQTTITRESTHEQWYENQGIAHTMIEKTLREGLGLLDGIQSISNNDDI